MLLPTAESASESFPFGTVFGAYSLWVLFSPETERMFAPSSTAS